ncbi:MAG: transposase [Planctomycetota bacterium]
MHLLWSLSRTITVADLVREMKRSTFLWVHERGEQWSAFAWQAGYGAFSVSPGHKAAVIKYIQNQVEHHHDISFQDELRRILKKNGVAFDER